MYALITEMARTRNAELRRDASKRRRARFGRRNVAAARAEAGPGGEVTFRRLDPASADREALTRLAGRDSSDPLEGEVLGAELDGSLVAAVSLDTHRAIADPFTPTAEIRSLLELRTGQLESAGSERSQGATVALRHAA